MTLIRTVVLVAVVAGAGEARAQYVPAGAFDGLVYGVMAADIGFGVAGVATAIGASGAATRGDVGNGWYRAALGMGFAQLAMSGVFLYGASKLAYGGQALNPFMAGVAVGHLGVGAWNLLAAISGFSVKTVQPTFLTGRGSLGNRWSGLGVQVAL